MNIFCLGDIHGKFTRLIEVMRSLPEGATIFGVGDIGLGFSDSLDAECLREVDFIAASRQQTLYFIRGNHDDPAIWHIGRHIWNEELVSVRILEDIGQVTLEGMNIMYVGGAISIDRSQSHRVDGKTWWKGEGVTQHAPEQITNLVKQYGQADLLITHAGPTHAMPVYSLSDPDIAYYAQYDAALTADIAEERELLSQVVRMSGAKHVAYGHYHQTFHSVVNGVTYRCCAELEAWQYMKRHGLPPLHQALSA